LCFAAFQSANETLRVRQTEPNANRYPIERRFEAKMRKSFQHFALLASEVVGAPAVFLLACLIVLVWGVWGRS
jgi:hypothetical protein